MAISLKEKQMNPQIEQVSLQVDAGSLSAIKVSNFLSKEERDALFESVCKHQNLFQPLGPPDPDGGGTLHISLESEHITSPEIEQLLQACETLANCMKKVLPQVFDKLGVEPFPVSEIPLSIGNGLDGHTGSPHTDESGGRFKISLLYYLHKHPKVFQGGALEFFKADANLPRGYREKALSKIEHDDNLLVAFPSETYHGVTDVSLDSTKFEDGRFVIVGFLGPK